MSVPSIALLTQIHRVAEELPALMLDSIVRVLLMEATATVKGKRMKGKLLSLLPKPTWRQEVCLLLDRWQAEAVELDGQAIALALMTAAHSQAIMRQKLSAELVWTGPNPEAIPLRRTDQTLLQLIRSAQKYLLIVSFAIYNIPEIVQALTEAIDRGVTVKIVAETPETSQGKISFGLATLSAKLLQRSQVLIWPREKRPVDQQGRFGSLHVKCALCDRQHLFISSANLTEYAMTLNMEMGILVHSQELAEQVIEHIDRLEQQGFLVEWTP